MILLGRKVTVASSTSKELIGLSGEVVEEGKETIHLRKNDGSEKLLIKQTITLNIEGEIFEGKNLRGTHASRMKK